MAHLEKVVLDEAWILFKTTGDLSHRNRLVLHYTSLVRYVAAKIGVTLPPEVDREDLISYGFFGLVDAIEKFDLDKGVKFETYAMARIRGAIYDEIRSLDWVPRSVRSKAREVDRSRTELEDALGRRAKSEELAQHLGLSVDEYYTLASQAAVTHVNSYQTRNADGEEGEYDFTIDPTSNPEDLAQTTEIIDLVGGAISHMDDRSKVIIALYYLQEMTLAEIGKILGVTESRVCQLQSRALQQLRAALGQGGQVAA